MTILQVVISIYYDLARYNAYPSCIFIIVLQMNASLHRSVSIGIRIAHQQWRPSNVTRHEKRGDRKHEVQTERENLCECWKTHVVFRFVMYVFIVYCVFPFWRLLINDYFYLDTLYNRVWRHLFFLHSFLDQNKGIKVRRNAIVDFLRYPLVKLFLSMRYVSIPAGSTRSFW